MRRKRLAVLATALLTPLAFLTSPATAEPVAPAATCDATTTPAHYRGTVPTPQSVLGFEIGDRQATSAESDRYLETVADASDRVISGTLATTAQGRPLKYAIVGKPSNVSKVGLAKIRLAAAALREPNTPDWLANEIARTGVPILWVTGNVHGNEPSGADAALKVLRDLSDRDDCAAAKIVDNALTVILPIQNPDGREANTRTNAYGFDMNRDWFARTQPETDGKLDLLNDYPPVLYIDAHEQGGTDYFFPPNADPIYHEIGEPAISWINDLYGAPMAAEFTRRGIDFYNRDVYDLFYMGYGDTVPTTGFNAAGMTFEKGGASPYPEKTFEQFLTQWISLSSAVDNRRKILTEWHQMYAGAYAEGKDGRLQPNTINNPPNEIITQVPDRAVRQYFLRADDPAKRPELLTIIRRLQRMGVAVQQLVQPLQVPDFKAYGREPAAVTLPRGTYMVSMAQAQKHWIQAMLNEDTYTPFPYFYDVTAWSMPLLGNVAGGSSGAVVKAKAVPVLPIPAFATAGRPRNAPKIAVLQLSAGSTATQSTGWLRHKLDREWKLPYTLLTPADVAAGRLAGAQVLLVPNGPAAAADTALGATGKANLQQWVQNGGRYVGWAGGTELAARYGLTTATLAEPTSAAPGTLFRVKVDPESPLAAGVGDTAWQFYSYDLVMTEPDPSRVAVSYPAADSPDWFVSGFEEGASELGGTAAVVDEPVGQGRAVLFAADPNFRALTDGTAKLLLNAIMGGRPTTLHRTEPRVVSALPDTPSAIRLAVRPGDTARALALLRSLGARWTERSTPELVQYTVDNPGELPADHHPWAARLPALLKQAGITPVAVGLP